MALGLNFDDIMEITLGICLEGDIHLDSKTSGEWALHVVLNLELLGLWASELQPAHTLADVSNRDCYFVILIWLDVYSK